MTSVRPADAVGTGDAVNKKRSVGYYVGLGLSAALLLVVIFFAAILIVIPKVAGATPLTVLTSSMKPALPPGTLIVVQPVEANDVAIGDVITYQIRSGDPDVITHRVIGINSTTQGDRSFILQGDNNSSPDAEAIRPEQIQARLWYSVPLVGYVNTAVNGENRAWIVPTGAVLLFAYATYAIASGVREASRSRRGQSARNSCIDVPVTRRSLPGVSSISGAAASALSHSNE